MNPLDIRLHLHHRLSISLHTSVYCRTCDYYLTDTNTVAIETNTKRHAIEMHVLTPLLIGEER